MTKRILPSLLDKCLLKTFVIDSSDDYIAAILKQHGWRQLQKSHPNWQFKWTWKADPKEIDSLRPQQIINHFKGSDEIATKLGLTLILRTNFTIRDTGKSYSTFYPRSYNLSTEIDEFTYDFLHTGVLILLKKLVACLQIYYEEQYAALLELKRQNFISDSGSFLKSLLERQKLFLQKSTSGKLHVDSNLFLRLLFYLESMHSLENYYEFSKAELIEMIQYGKSDLPFPEQGKAPSNQALLLVHYYFQKCNRQIGSFYQDGFSNIWIIKSNHSSRGRGISLIDNLKQIQDHNNGMKLIQKYIENIWVLHQLTASQQAAFPFMRKIFKKKFDVRLWVLIKSVNPLQIYVYDEGYLRISADSYRLDELQEHTAHLTNYAVNWRKKEQKTKKQQSNSYIILSQFLNFLKTEENVNISEVKQKIDEIIVETFKCVNIKENKKCFELFGFDVILDAQLRPWLLECNMSPSCTARGQLKNLTKQMFAGMLSMMGLINGPFYQWRLLFYQQSTSHFLFSNLPVFEGKVSSKFVNTLGNGFENGHVFESLRVRKLKWKKYQEIEQYEHAIEKLRKIQRFYKDRKKKSILKGPPCAGASKCAGLIQILAKIKKRKMAIWLKIMVKRFLRIRRKFLA